MNPKLALALVCVCAPYLAQAAPPAASAPAHVAAAAPDGPPEPNVRHIVVEDDNARIEELRVRGQTQYVVVTPKSRIGGRYEILVGRGGRTATDGTGGADNAVGKRVWNVLAF